VMVIDYNQELFSRCVEQFQYLDQGSVSVVKNVHKQGLSGARNTGINCATKEIVAFVDDDAVIDKDWVELLRAHYSNQLVAGVGGYAEPVWPVDRPMWIPEEFDWVVGCSHRGLPTGLTQVRNFIGCNMSFRREILSSVGGFSTEIGRVGTKPLGCEETEVCIRITAWYPELALLFDPKIRVKHSVTSNRTTLKYFLDRCFSEGISKRQVALMVGAHSALESERAYVRKILPRGIIRELSSFLRQKKSEKTLSGFQRAAAILIGLMATASGYGYAITLSYFSKYSWGVGSRDEQ
ncbi:MAG: glycosyltransferase, partial [Mycobacteriaceae bacterium]